MWIQTLDRRMLVNLETGQRLAIVATGRDQEVELYGVAVQTPIAETLLDQKLYPMLTGFNNTLLVEGALLDDCENLLEIIRLKLEAWQVPNLPIPEEMLDAGCILQITDHFKSNHRYICEDEETARRVLHRYVKEHWSHSPAKRLPIPEDREEAIGLYYKEATSETYQTFVVPVINYRDIK